MIYYAHSEDFDFEFEVELGIFSKRKAAEKAIAIYCEDNKDLVNVHGMVIEKIINKSYVDKMEWAEGFTI